MKKIAMILVGTALICSCSQKNKENTPKPGSMYNNNHVPQKRDGGDDDDPEIIIEKTIVATANGYGVVSGSVVTVSNVNDTISGTTDEFGECKIHLPHLGFWNLSIVSQGYVPVNVNLNLQDTVTNRIDTLQVQL